MEIEFKAFRTEVDSRFELRDAEVDEIKGPVRDEFQ